MIKARVLILCISLFFYKSKSQVSLDWVRTYSNNALDTAAQPLDLGIDDSDNVYVVGTSNGINMNPDIVVIKYDLNGSQKWVSRYNLGGDHIMIPHNMCTDKKGNTYVVGVVSNFSDSIFVIKYNYAGILQWDWFYGGGHGDDVAVDDSGYVYMTGITGGIVFTTAKIDRNGGTKWIVSNSSSYAGGVPRSSIAIDSLGNSYCLVRADASSNFSSNTIKYDNNGVKQWENVYIGPNGSSPTDIKVDKSGNIYILTLSSSITKYSPNGGLYWSTPSINLVWATCFDVDKNGNIYLGGSFDTWANCYDDAYWTGKFNYSGTNQWAQMFTDTNCNWDRINDIAIDGSGFIYVTGVSPGDLSGEDFVTIKYDQNGNPIWKERYPNTNQEEAYKIALGKNGTVYCFGIQQLQDSGWHSRLITVKYSQIFTGIKELNANENLKIYPNPVSNRLYISSKQYFEKGSQIEIVNTLGQTVLKLNYTNEIDVSDLSQGYYILKITSPNKRQFHSKFLKE